MKRFFFFLLLVFPFCFPAQNVTVNITLNTTEGGVHSYMPVTLVDTVTKAAFKGKTDGNGKASVPVPANAVYDLLIPNYTMRKLIRVPNAPGATMNTTLFYSRDMVSEEKAFAMSDAEKAEVDRFASALPDTTWFKGNNPFQNSSNTYYAKTELELSDFNKGPLAGETVTVVGRSRKKAFKGTTDANGKLLLYLPKGDNYDLSFYYHKNFETTECKYSKGNAEMKWSFEYIGTKAFAKQKKEEEDRQKAEKQRAEGANGIAALFERNKFATPLIICDASANMKMITDDLQSWFSKNAKTFPGAQFVFFNDGDGKKTEEKKVGETGGMYYTPALPLDKLSVFLSAVIGKSKDEDGPDNCVEGLVKGVKMAKQPYSDIILIVDNHATARDISLLSQVTQPVHVVVFCSIKGGCDQNFCQPDYLKIAWKTKGTLHINYTDYNDIGKLKNGDTITIMATKYKLVNGEFFQVS